MYEQQNSNEQGNCQNNFSQQGSTQESYTQQNNGQYGYGQPGYNQQTYNQQGYYQSNDSGGFLWALLGFFVPLAGLILYLVWKDEKPRTSKAAGIGALVSVIAGIVFFILYIVIVFFITGALIMSTV